MLACSDIKNAIAQYDTPFYLYQSDVMCDQYQGLKKSLGGYADIFYSIKANPNIAICQYLRNLGASAEICSEYEFYAALRAGFRPSNMIFVGPSKTDDEIKLCLMHEIYAIVCESILEYKRISQIAVSLNKTARVALRINPDFCVNSAMLKMGGKPSQFGIDEKSVFDCRDFYIAQPNMKIVGIHVYNGTRILDADSIVQNTQKIFMLACQFEKNFSVELEMVDIGGGLGIPYYTGEGMFDLDYFEQRMIPELEKFHQHHPKTRVILESGRFLVGLSGVFVTRVVDVKSSKGENFIVTDGGTNCHMAAVGVGGLIKRNFPIRHISPHKKPTEKIRYHMTGPLCTPGDLIAQDILLEEVSVGDWIVVDHSGAYGPTASPVLFLSHGYPAEILIEQGASRLIRLADSAHDLFRNQRYKIGEPPCSKASFLKK